LRRRPSQVSDKMSEKVNKHPLLWIFLLLSSLAMFLLASQVIAEERGCLATYGNEYREYMNRTPRWIGMPKTS
jgi:protein-S-isoprenylcysteine O-methyltransferase Ste14